MQKKAKALGNFYGFKGGSFDGLTFHMGVQSYLKAFNKPRFSTVCSVQSERWKKEQK